MLQAMGGNRSLSWVVHRGVLFVAQNPGLPTHDDWAQYLSEFNVMLFDGVLVTGHDNKLSVSQRSDVEVVPKRNQAKLALVTNSAITRGVLTALGWMGVKVKAFAPSDVPKALAFLGMPTDARAEAVAVIQQLQLNVRAMLPKPAANG